MELRFHIVMIRDIQFGDRTGIHDGVLTINRNELQKILERDKRFGRVDIELARPGEKCRITGVADVIEPRAKINEGDEDPGGSAGRHEATGVGTTCVLRGSAIVLIDRGDNTIFRIFSGFFNSELKPRAELMNSFTIADFPVPASP